MTNNGQAWFSMMGLTKVLLRNFVIGVIVVLFCTVATLAQILNTVYHERLMDEREFRTQIVKLKQDCQDAVEAKNSDYVKMLREALENQSKLERELREFSQKQRTKR